MRLELTPAAGLPQAVARRQCMPPDPRALGAFLRETPAPGSRPERLPQPLRPTRNTELTMPSPGARAGAQGHRARSRANLIALPRRAGNPSPNHPQRRQLRRHDFHHRPSRMANNLPPDDLERQGLPAACHNPLPRDPLAARDANGRASREQPAQAQAVTANRPRTRTQNPMTQPVPLRSTPFRSGRAATASAPLRVTASPNTAPPLPQCLHHPPSTLLLRARPINDPATSRPRTPPPTHRPSAGPPPSPVA